MILDHVSPSNAIDFWRGMTTSGATSRVTERASRINVSKQACCEEERRDDILGMWRDPHIVRPCSFK